MSRMRRTPPEPSEIARIETWVFDLDNTLYHPSAHDLFPAMDERMNAFIADLLDCDVEAANRYRRQWFERHGTTLRGLIEEHGVEPAAFLEFVHDLDLSGLALNARLDRALAALPGRKVIFTNATETHAVRVTERLGIRHHFEAVFDVVAADYLPKPNARAYARFMERHGIAPASAAMFEDTARNLEPARQLGMTTVWVETERPNARPAPDADYIDFGTDDLVGWLEAVAR